MLFRSRSRGRIALAGEDLFFLLPRLAGLRLLGAIGAQDSAKPEDGRRNAIDDGTRGQALPRRANSSSASPAMPATMAGAISQPVGARNGSAIDSFRMVEPAASEKPHSSE